MRCYYINPKTDEKVPFDIPDETCDLCNSDLFYVEPDWGRASVACTQCDFQMWVYPPNKKGEIKRLLPDEIQDWEDEI